MKWGQGKKGDSAQRSLAKALLWRVFAASNTLICGVFLAKDFSVASKIAGSDTVVKTVSTGGMIPSQNGGKLVEANESLNDWGGVRRFCPRGGHQNRLFRG